MKILYDFQAFSYQNYGGVSNCFVQLIKNLPNDVRYSISIKESNNIHLLESNLVNIEEEFFNLDNFFPYLKFNQKVHLYYILQKRLYKLFPTAYNINMIYSLKQVENNDFDIFHPTFFDSYFLPYLKKPFVMTIHDMAPEIFNFSKEQIRGKIKQATRASRIIAVSENTKKDIIRYLNVPEEKIEVIYHGYVPSEVDNHTKSIIEGPYILYVGDRSIAYKNFSYFTRQIAIFLGSHKEFKMVCTGKEFSKEELLMFNNLGIEKKIIHLFCNTSELNNLYVHAFSFVYPSIYEGFGIPILEAFNANCLVILNKKSCFPEIAKDGALYFDSDNEDKKLSTVLEDVFSMSNSDRQNLIIKGKNRLKKFSWVKSAEKLSNIYRDISEGVQ